MSWFIGLLVVGITDGYAAHQLATCGCDAPFVLDYAIIALVPATYLWLTQLAFKRLF